MLARLLRGGRHLSSAAPVVHEAPAHVRTAPLRLPDAPDDARFLAVAVVGAPNAGKSTLVNALTGARVSAVSSKYNTTRQRVMGAFTRREAQLAFYDTPGFVAERTPGEFQPLVVTAAKTVTATDVALLVVDCARKWHPEYEAALRRLLATAAEAGAEPLVVLNKVDRLRRKDRLLRSAEDMAALVEAAYGRPYQDPVFMVSATRDDGGVADVREELLRRARPGFWAVPADVRTEHSQLELVSEVVREAVFAYLRHELPYRVFQENRAWQDSGSGLRIDQDLLVERDAQARIVRAALGRIEAYARRELREELGRPDVHIRLRVRTEKKLRYYSQ